MSAPLDCKLLEVKGGISFMLASQNLAQSFTYHQTSVAVVVFNRNQHGHGGYLQKILCCPPVLI